MGRQTRFTMGVVAVVVFLCLPVVRAGTADNPRVASLLAQASEQQQRIDALETRLAAASTQDSDKTRADVMRQQIREILSEQEFRESLMSSTMQAGYDNGFFIRSSDDKFSLLINGLVQFRWQHYGTRADNRYLNPRLQRNDRTGFDVARLRLDFSGHAYSPDLTYFLELEADSADGYNVVLGEGWANYRCCDALQMKAGLFKAASTRANLIGNGAMQFVDRPMFDAVYGLGFGIGVRFWGHLCDNRFDYYVDVLNSLGSGEDFAVGRTITTDPSELDGNPALVARLVWHALGEDIGNDFADEADLGLHETPALDFGVHYAFNDDEGDVLTTRIPYPVRRPRPGRGAFGLTSTNGMQIHQFGVDTAFKYMGFSATAEYAFRTVDPRRAGRTPFTPWWLLTTQESTTMQHGGYAQVGYFLPIPGFENKFEAVARVGAISALADGQQGAWEYGGGLNYYIDGNRIKLQTDVIKIDEAPISNPYSGMANVNDDVLLWRVQLQVAF